MAIPVLDNSISFRKAAYVAGAAAGIGCLGPVSVLGYIGAAAAGALGAVAIDAMRAIGQKVFSPYYAKLTHHIAPPLHLEQQSNQLDEAFSRIQSHPAYLFLVEKRLIKEDLTAATCLQLSSRYRRGEGEISELLHLIDEAPNKPWNELLEAIDAEKIYYLQMLHILKLLVDCKRMERVIKNVNLMYGPGSEGIIKEIKDREEEIELLQSLSKQLASELYPYQVLNGSVTRRSLECNLKKLIQEHPSQEVIKGRMTILSAQECQMDDNQYQWAGARLLWIHDGSYTIPERCPGLSECGNRLDALTGRSIFFQCSEGFYRFYDPLEGAFEFDNEDDFFCALGAMKSSLQMAQFSLYLPQSDEGSSAFK